VSCPGISRIPGPAAWTPAPSHLVFSSLRSISRAVINTSREVIQPSIMRTARLRRNRVIVAAIHAKFGDRLKLRIGWGQPSELVAQAGLAARIEHLQIYTTQRGGGTLVRAGRMGRAAHLGPGQRLSPVDTLDGPRPLHTIAC